MAVTPPVTRPIDAPMRPLRSDAQRNREHILRIARDLLAESGAKVSVDEIAKAAGVGVGTVHRHFPTKAHLIEAVLVLAYAPMVEAIEDALDGDDAGAGLEQFLFAILEFQSDHRALAEEMREARAGSTDLAEMKAKITAKLDELVARAQASGQIRADIGTGDLRLIFIGLAQTATAAGAEITPTEKARFVRIVLDGLRSPVPSALPGDAPEL